MLVANPLCWFCRDTAQIIFVSIVFTDEAKPEIATVKPQPQTQETVGIVVGVILGLIFLVAIAIVAIILFR
jgi:hypothetical protein